MWPTHVLFVSLQRSFGGCVTDKRTRVQTVTSGRRTSSCSSCATYTFWHLSRFKGGCGRGEESARECSVSLTSWVTLPFFFGSCVKKTFTFINPCNVSESVGCLPNLLHSTQNLSFLTFPCKVMFSLNSLFRYLEGIDIYLFPRFL